ncbi:MAG TPA: ImmA/IrrE family metallo-endopeptidase [Lacipirellulaceae bacterium]|nr:ImmA/IrrE family metallo-endopeptidase [Lacipirellulaceae bacterium]
MLSEVPNEEFAAAVDVCAAEALWEAGVDAPPVDALAVADGLRLVVARDSTMAYRGRYVRLADCPGNGGGQGTIVVGVAERPEREQWAVAHEIGESIAYRVFERLGVAFDEVLPTAREHVSNRLANALLLPRRWFDADGRELDWDLLELKERYTTASHELIARRMLEMRPPVVITICDQGRIHWRRSNVTLRPPEMLREERAIWREVHESGIPIGDRLDADTGLESVRCWPVHEPDWKREIIRSAIAEI